MIGHRPFSSQSPSFQLLKLFLQLFIHILLLSLPIASGLFTSVCQFPRLDDWLGCQRDPFLLSADSTSESMAPLNGWFCDPESSMSMSEVSALDESIQRLYLQHGQTCVCPSNQPEEDTAGPKEVVAESTHCWHRFGFAFVRQLGPVGSDVIRADQCSPQPTQAASNESTQGAIFYEEATAERRFELPSNWESEPDHGFSLYAQNFAQVLRERWALGQCGEDVLLLVVQRPPVQQLSAGPLSSATIRLFGPLPMLFLAPGPLVLDRLGPLLPELVSEANSQLQREGRPLFRVLGQLLSRVGLALAKTQPSGGANNHLRPKLRSHVPLWAWAVFAACGICFGLMALGLFLIRTGTRRNTSMNGQQQAQGHGAMVARRHWKEEEQPPPPTYVNLVQMLMPHPKPPPTNMPQQV